jgi:putative FmdB family regulatory protein
MPLNEYVCCSCGERQEIIEKLEEASEEKVCGVCGGKMSKVFPGKCTFHLKYNNQRDMCSWGNEGYASSQYWEQHKKE